jgi:hypothetical protein
MNFKTISLGLALAFSGASFADGTSFDFTKSNLESHVTSNTGTLSQIGSGNSYSGFSMQVGGLSVDVSAWSDTAPNSNDNTSSSGYDGQVTDATLSWYSGGWSVNNDDELYGSDKSHGFDNGAIYQNSDGSYYASEGSSDLDMVLLEFNEAVSLEGFTVGWQKSYWDSANSPDRIDNAGAVALDDNQVGLMLGSDSGSVAQNWSQIWAGSSISKVGVDIDPNVNSQYYSLTGVTGTDSVVGAGTDGEYSKYWLVGLFNEMENCVDYDAFKLLGVTATRVSNTNEVPEPGSIAMFLVGLTLLYKRQQKAAFKL